MELPCTPVDAIPGIAKAARLAFLSQKTRSLEFRLVQLRKLYWGLKDNAKAIDEACKKDIGKGAFETGVAELDFCTHNIVLTCNNLEKWAKDEWAPDIPLTTKFMSPKIRKDPYGCILILGPYNFPMNLTICPLIGAIAAGNTVVVKPSEQAPYTALILQNIIESSLDSSCYKVVQGAVPEATALLNEKWDKIFYTGSANVGTIVAKKAAETLTPVTLELGGRNPAIVTKNANIHLAARRLLWAKTMNAGQACISQNYTLVDSEVVEGFVAEMQASLKSFFPNGARYTDDYGRIVNQRQWNRLRTMLEKSKGKIVAGGDMDEADCYIGPTVVIINSPHDSLMQEESFGPLMPILPVKNLDEAIRIANETDDTPLGLYPFGNQEETDRCLREIRSGGASVNDGMIHGTLPSFAFGGVGNSGQGNYRGRASFDCFTHRRSITKTPGWLEGMLNVRYPPFEGKLAQFRKMSELKPNFDREGRVKGGLAAYILGLGAQSTTGGLIRYAVLVFVALGLKQYLG